MALLNKKAYVITAKICGVKNKQLFLQVRS